MAKFILYVFILTIIVICGASIYHLYKVNAKNKAEMADFAKDVPLKADLGRVLVVYYSLTGNTKHIAELIANKTDADLFAIETVETYSSPSVYVKSKKELATKNYPALKNKIMPSIENYDTIFIGAPVWWYTMAPALYSFLNNTDFQGKYVVPFSTQGSNYGSFFEDFAKTAQNAEILPHASFNNGEGKYSEQLSNKINSWLNDLK